MPRTPMFSPRGATESRAMNLPATFGESLVPGTATVHLGVPLHDFLVRDAIDLLLHRELVLGFPQIDDPAGGRVALELRDHELPLPPAGFERRDHLGTIEDDVAIAHVELRDDHLAQIQEQVVHRGEHELSAEPELPDAVDVLLQDPHHGALAAGEEALREPALSFELPETLAGLPHVVLEPRAGRKGFRRRHAEAPDDPAQDLSAGLLPTDLQIRNEAIAVVRVPRHMESLVQDLERGRGRGPAEVREDEESLAGDRALLFNQLQDRLHLFGESLSFRGLEETEVVLGAVGPVFGDREALGEQTVPMQSVQRSEVFHTEPCREIGSEPTERFRGLDRIREPRIGRDAVFVDRVGKKIALLEVEGPDRPVRDEIGEPHETGPLPWGEIRRLRDLLALESRDTQYIDPPKNITRHHPHQAVDRVLQQIGRRQVELADLDAPAHLPDLRHPDEIPVLHEW